LHYIGPEAEHWVLGLHYIGRRSAAGWNVAWGYARAARGRWGFRWWPPVTGLMEGGLTRNDRAECPVDCHLEGSRSVSSSLYFATTWLVGLDVLHSLDLQAAQLSVCRPHGKMHVGRGPWN